LNTATDSDPDSDSASQRDAGTDAGTGTETVSETATVSPFRTGSNGTNGLMFDLDGRLCCCEGGAGRLTALEGSGNVTEILTDAYNGTRYNRPNDLILDQQGGVYFTDPIWEPTYPQDVKGARLFA
jgi:sugar lactone lactonase YvrE